MGGVPISLPQWSRGCVGPPPDQPQADAHYWFVQGRAAWQTLTVLGRLPPSPKCKCEPIRLPPSPPLLLPRPRAKGRAFTQTRHLPLGLGGPSRPGTIYADVLICCTQSPVGSYLPFSCSFWWHRAFPRRQARTGSVKGKKPRVKRDLSLPQVSRGHEMH